MSSEPALLRGSSRLGASTGRAIGLLSVLYFVQGLPFGFLGSALPLYLRAEGVSLSTIGYASALGAPWALKALWAPFVDRAAPGRLGRRKRWIVPMQLALLATVGAASFVEAKTHLALLLFLVFLMNLFAATMDVAVDGLAVDLLRDDELGLGNAAQVAGFKLGMMTAGGGLVVLSGSAGFRGVFVGIAVLVALAFVVVLSFREPEAKAPSLDGSRIDFRSAMRRVGVALAEPSGRFLIVLVLAYKAGEEMADGMFRPMLVDRGFAPADLALWLSTYGTAASLVGSILGGLLASRFRLLPLLFTIAAIRVVPLLLELRIALGEGGTAYIVGVSVAEHFVGGLLTPVVFSFMMSSVDPRIGATHYTVLAAFENLGKGTARFWAGALAERLGYAPVYGLAIVASVLFLALHPPMEKLARKGAYVRPPPA